MILGGLPRETIIGAIRRFPRFIAVLSIALGATSAHESPEHTIQALGERADLTSAQLHQRALAHRAIHDLDEAIDDLHAAIAMEPNDLSYRFELCEAQLAAGDAVEVRHSADHALKLATSADQQARIWILRAQSYQLEHKPKNTLAAAQQAFQKVPKGEIEWILLRSESQRALGFHQRRIDDLTKSLEDHPSAVLRTHRLDALIDASKFAVALDEIDQELAERRWKSTYWVMRARCLIGLGQKQDAHIALQSALVEITSRLNPVRPDLFLLVDQGFAYALLGQETDAENSLKLLQKHDAPAWMIDRLQELMKSK